MNKQNLLKAIKGRFTKAKDKLEAKHKEALSVLNERAQIVAAIELIRLELGMTSNDYAKALDVLGSPVKLSVGDAQPYRNIVSGYCGNKFEHIVKIFSLAEKLQKHHGLKNK